LPGQDSDYALVDDALPHGKIHRIKSTTRKEEPVVPGMYCRARTFIKTSTCPAHDMVLLKGEK